MGNLFDRSMRSAQVDRVIFAAPAHSDRFGMVQQMTGWRIQLHATIVMHTCKACSLSADDPVVALR